MTSKSICVYFKVYFYLRGSFLSALGRNWHPEHFNCAGCRKSLQNKGFVEESDNLYCEGCYDMKFAPHCDVCNEAIVGVS